LQTLPRGAPFSMYAIMCFQLTEDTAVEVILDNDGLEDKSEYYQNCSVLYCVPHLWHLYTVISVHVWAVLTGVLDILGTANDLMTTQHTW